MRDVLLALGLVAVAAGGVFAYEHFTSSGHAGKSRLEMRMAPKVSSIAGQWSLHDLKWEEFDGAWRVSTTFIPTRISSFKATHREMLQSFCGAVLTSMPEKPSEEIARSEVYRVDINVVLGDLIEDEVATVFPKNMPVPVRDGACLGPKKDKFILYPTYPGTLVGWRPEDVYFHNGADGEFAEIVFYWTDPGEASHDGFDFLAACNAAMADSLVISTFEDLTNSNPEFSLDNATQMKVSAKHRYGSRYLNVSKGGHLMLDLVNGKCVRQGASEDA